MEDQLIRDTLYALERLMRMFALERLLYLLCAVVSFVLLMICLWTLIETKQIAVPQLAAIFGATGMISVAAYRVSYFLNRSFDLISKIIELLIKLRERE